MKKVRVDIGNKSYEVLVEIIGGEPAPAAPPRPPTVSAKPLQQAESIKSAATPAPAPSGKINGQILSPLAGRVVEIAVKVGDVVSEGTKIATIEAMKMNTYVNATAAGRVAEISIAPGTSVQEGTPLVRLE